MYGLRCIGYQTDIEFSITVHLASTTDTTAVQAICYSYLFAAAASAEIIFRDVFVAILREIWAMSGRRQRAH